MEVKVLYFGEIAEWKGFDEELKQLDSTANTEDLVQRLLLEIPQLEQINYAIALNQKMINSPEILTHGCEVSVFPPFAGG